MATRGRPRKNPLPEPLAIWGYQEQDIRELNAECSSLRELNVQLSFSNTTLQETLSDKNKAIEELEAELGKLEDENEHLKEIIKSLAEVL